MLRTCWKPDPSSQDTGPLINDRHFLVIVYLQPVSTCCPYQLCVGTCEGHRVPLTPAHCLTGGEPSASAHPLLLCQIQSYMEFRFTSARALFQAKIISPEAATSSTLFRYLRRSPVSLLGTNAVFHSALCLPELDFPDMPTLLIKLLHSWCLLFPIWLLSP